MSWHKVNLNDRVRFRITRYGVKFLKKNHPDLKLKRQKGGWVETQLWDFISLFGPAIHIGFNPPVKPDIEIGGED